ncbi:MAG: TolC family protein [Ignavibacteria bacterium]|nr:TolC family protein [Ignavibacteria bacterium]
MERRRNVAQPLFQGGKLAAQVDVADANTKEAVALYRQSILVAFKEVNDALVDVVQRRSEVDATVAGVKSNRDVLRLSELRYRYGATPYLQVLDAQRSLLDAQRKEVTARAAWYVAYIRLYKALGGGWR